MRAALSRLLLSAVLAGDKRAPGSTVGIDLGTTNSAIAVFDGDGNPRVVPNVHGEMTTPSVVAYGADGSAMVGQEAIAHASTDVSNVVFSAKRFIGRPLRSVQSFVEAAGAPVREGVDGDVAFECPACTEPVAAEEVSAQVLRSLLADAERHTGQRADRAVITIPAYFDERQRLATLAAARLAGLAEVQLLAEPVAACVAHQLSGAVGTILVFDLGAGTFDVSVLRLSAGGDLEVVATSGDARLGGNDFDAALVGWLRKEGAVRLGTSYARDPAALRQLREASEAAKKRLSVVKQVDVPLPGGSGGSGGKAAAGGAVAGGGAAAGGAAAGGAAGGAASASAAAVTLSRATLEAVCDELFRRMKRPLYEVALSARLTLPGELDAEHGTVRPRLNAKQRKAAAKRRPEGKQRYLPTGAPVDEIVLVIGACTRADYP